MVKPVAVITGTSSGFGFLTALQFLKNGYYVIATMRDVSKKEQLLAEINTLGLVESVMFHELDVTDSNSIQGLNALLTKIGRIDVLVNNAGFATGGFAEDVSKAEYLRQFETNFFGITEVTQTILPFMRKQRKGKIINISSISGQIGFPGLSPYVSSKFALEGYSECLRLEVKPFGIDVVLVEPGSYQTNIWTSGKKIAEQARKEASPYFLSTKKLENQIEEGKHSFGDPNVVAKLVCNLAGNKVSKKLRYPIGKGVKMAIYLKKTLPWKVWEKLLLKNLR